VRMHVTYKLGIVGLAATVFAFVYWRFTGDHASPSAPIAPVPVVTALVRQHDEPIALSGLGTVAALNTASIQSQVTGVLVEVDFTEGETVKKGEILAKIDPRLYQAALEQAQGQLAKDTALHAQAESDLARYQKLGTENSIALQQVADQQFLVAQDAAAMEAGRGMINMDQTNLDYTTLRAPFDGVTGILQTEVGNLIQPTNTTGIVVLTQVQPIAVVFILPQADIAAVQTALAKGPVQATVYDQSGSKQLDVGKLLTINNQALPSSGTVQRSLAYRCKARLL
jgi:membrane fusion protein, multidrug efflux system